MLYYYKPTDICQGAGSNPRLARRVPVKRSENRPPDQMGEDPYKSRPWGRGQFTSLKFGGTLLVRV